MTAGTSPSRRVARAAPLPARSRATASIRTVWTIGRTPLAWEKVLSGTACPGHGRGGLQGCRRGGGIADRRGQGNGKPRRAPREGGRGRTANGEPPAAGRVADPDAAPH